MQNFLRVRHCDFYWRMYFFVNDDQRVTNPHQIIRI